MLSTKPTCDKQEQHINVFIRIRPLNSQEIEKKCSNLVHTVNDCEIHIKQTYASKIYRYDHIFDDMSTQKEVFNTVVSPLLEEVLNGYNCTIFAYGQTGSGKTYTMLGPDSNNVGIIPRSIDAMFELLGHLKNDSNIRISYLELYNEELIDLLATISDTKTIKIYDDKTQKGSVIIQGVEEVTVKTKDEVHKLLEMGSEKRQIASTLMNANSSRSHTVFTIVVRMREVSTDGEEMVRTGKLNLVDLAGSENISRSGSVDKRAREAGSINQSLLTLGRVIKALTEKSAHIPYRESKLTRILQDSLGGRVRTSLIATVSFADDNLEETVNTFEYAMRVRCIQNRPEVNQQMSQAALINQYTEEIERLRKDLQACRSSSGVYLDKDNYNEMLTNFKKQQDEIVAKQKYLKCLAKRVEEITDKVALLKNKHADEVNNIESLIKEKEILDEHRIAISREREEHKNELDQIKVEYDRLTNESRKLISAVKDHHQNEAILSSKLSLLHDTANYNVNTMNEFHTISEKLNMEMVKRIQQCITLTHIITTQGTESMECLKSKLNETFWEIKKITNELSTACNRIDNYKKEYFNVKSSIEGEVVDYIQTLDHILDTTFSDVTYVLNKIEDEYLNNSYATMQVISDEHCKNVQVLTDSLYTLRGCTSALSKRVTDLVLLSQQSTTEAFEKITFLHQQLTANSKFGKSFAKELKKDMCNRIGNIKTEVSAMKEEFSCKLKKLNVVCQENVQLSEQLCGTCKDLTGIALESVTHIKNASENFSREISSCIAGPQQHVKEAENEEAELRRNATNEVNKSVYALEEQKQKSKTLFDEFSGHVTQYGSNIFQRERLYNSYINALNESCQKLNVGMLSTSDRVDDMYRTVNEINSGTEKALEDYKFELQCTKDFLKCHENKMSTTVNDFCQVKHPTHVGDTPQRLEPIISTLNVVDFDYEEDLLRIEDL